MCEKVIGTYIIFRSQRRYSKIITAGTGHTSMGEMIITLGVGQKIIPNQILLDNNSMRPKLLIF